MASYLSRLDISPRSLLDVTPLMQPPAGVQSNFVNPVSNADIARIPTFVLLPLMLAFVGIRIIGRFVLAHASGADDYMCIAATILVTAWCSMSLSLLDHPHGHHMWDIPVSAIGDAFLKKTYTITILYICSSAAVRVSIFILYLRLFGHVCIIRTSIWTGLSITIAAYTAFLISHLYYCTPRAADGGWSLQAYERCADPDISTSIAQAVFGSAADAFMLLLPIVQVMRLNMPMRRRIGIAAIFMTGLLGLASSLACAVLRVYLLRETDLFWEVTKIYAFGTVEVTIGIICCCMPIIPAVARSVLDSKIRSSMNSYLQHWTKESSQKRALEETKVMPIAAKYDDGSSSEPGLSKKPTPGWDRYHNSTHQQPSQTHPSLSISPSYIELESLDGR